MRGGNSTTWRRWMACWKLGTFDPTIVAFLGSCIWRGAPAPAAGGFFSSACGWKEAAEVVVMKHWMCCCWAAGKKKVQLKALLLLSPLPFRTPPWCIERKLEEITTAGGGALFPSRQPNALEAICFFLLLLPATFFNLFFLLPVPHKHDLPPLSQFSSSPLPLPLPATTSKLHEKTKTPTSKISKLKLPSFPSQSCKLFSIRKKQSSADHMDDHTSQGGSENDLAQSLTDGNSPSKSCTDPTEEEEE